MNILIAGGTGFIGQALVKHLYNSHNGYNLTILTRNNSKASKVFQKYSDIDYITWAELESDKDKAEELIFPYDIIINLCGLSIGERRWSEKFKQQVISSRVEPTRLLADTCAQVASKYGKNIALYNASAIGIYGLSNPTEIYTEDSSIRPPQDFLSQVGFAWEKAALNAVANNVRVVFMRFGVVLDISGGALKKMALPFKFGLGGKVGSGKQPFSWIALDDLVRIIEVLIQDQKISGPINLVAPEIVSQEQLAQNLARYLHRPCFMPLPSFMVKLIFGQMGNELLLQGQLVKSYKLNFYYQEWLAPNLDKFFAK